MKGSELTITGAGAIVIKATQPGNEAYAPAPHVHRTVVSNKAKLTVSATHSTIFHGQPVSPVYTMSGFVNGDTQSSAITGRPTLTTAATQGARPGAYSVTISTGTLKAKNYLFSFINGSLTITVESVLHYFGIALNDGEFPESGVVLDSKGNLYGTTPGMVFELTPSATGWNEKILHSFPESGFADDGLNSRGGLSIDRSGNLYGTTFLGGSKCNTSSSTCCVSMGGTGCGTVYELSRSTSGWLYKVIYNFKGDLGGGTDGFEPVNYDGLVSDDDGNLYGTTSAGGKYGGGTVFELLRPAAGDDEWTEKVLYSFPATIRGPGNVPVLTSLIIDPAGNLFGVTYFGGDNNQGSVFELSPGDPWKQTVLHSFAEGGEDGFNPLGRLLLDSEGNLYGSAVLGGSSGGGVVFKLSPGQPWTETILHNFGSSGDGTGPNSGLVMDSEGDLYGATGGTAGTSQFAGTLYKLSFDSIWSENVLHFFTFGGPRYEAAEPLYGALAMDRYGVLYGTSGEGTDGDTLSLGTVYGFATH